MITRCFFLFIFALSTISYCEKIEFNAKSLTLNFPGTIIASGNTAFKSQELQINSDSFQYNFDQQKGTFIKNVKIKNNNSNLSGNLFMIDYLNSEITGKGNIALDSNTIKATSDDLRISNYEILTLMNNVKVQQNGSQIKSNQLIYNLKTDTIISDKRIKLIIKE